jgi:DNA-binding transcriptional LysR family regulator
MQTRQIDYFLALCEELNFSRAAKRCGISQPSLTNAIMALEAMFGGPLFDRKPAVRLTQRGHAIRPHLTLARQEVWRAVGAAAGVRPLINGHVVSGSNESTARQGT